MRWFYYAKYYLTADGGQSGVLSAVQVVNGIAEDIVAMLIPHASDVGPPLRTGRGVPLLAPLHDVRRTYGTPADAEDQMWVYATEGVAFLQSGGYVFGILIFKPGASPKTGR